MNKRTKTLSIALAVILVLFLILWGGWRWFTRQAIPQTSGKIHLAGLSRPVEVLRDEYGVPHIYAHTPDDLFFAQGFIHAQERFWQMEFQRRTAAGRLSEVFGDATLNTDIYLRQFGFYNLTEQSYNLLDGETRRVVDAYTAGVNAYIADRKPAQLGLEFAFLGLQGVKYEIEEWTAVDSLIWGEMMIFDQSDQMRTELRNIELLALVGQEKYADLRPLYRPDRPTIIPSEEFSNGGASNGAAMDNPAPGALSEADLRFLLLLRDEFKAAAALPVYLADLGFTGSGASNSFAISGERTASGKALLANDPHMGVSMPALWYEVGLHCVEKSAACIYNFRGFSLPGVPGILIGHNDRIAWGLTNAAFDAEDVFIEKLNPENPDQYEVNGKWVDMEIRREEIKVRGQDAPEALRVRSTRNGVVASDAMVDRPLFSYDQEGPQLFALSYAWTALEPVRSVQATLMVIRAQNWDEFNDALAYFDAGKQNWLYADVEGNIGYIMPGKVPIRAGGDGSLPVPGWNDDYIWTGFIPYDEAPRVFNPAQGFIATANNPQAPYEDYPYLINTSQDRGQRAQRITELIQADLDGLTIQELTQIQTDNQSISALEVIPYLRNLSFDDAAVSTGRDRLVKWDAQMVMESPEAALYNIFWVHLIAETFHDQLPPGQRPSGSHMTSDTIYYLLQEPDGPWWDDIATVKSESRDDILAKAFEAAYAEGVEKFGADFDKWRWGAMHTITFQNATLGSSGIGLIENIFNRGPFETNGSESVVQKTCWSVNSSFEVGCIPALRQVIDLGNLSNSLMIQSVGQSGHPMHPQYDNFIDMWRLFQYHPSNWARSDVESGKFDLLVLEP